MPTNHCGHTAASANAFHTHSVVPWTNTSARTTTGARSTKSIVSRRSGNGMGAYLTLHSPPKSMEEKAMSSRSTQRMKIADFLLRRLEDADIRHLFGVPGDYT